MNKLLLILLLTLSTTASAKIITVALGDSYNVFYSGIEDQSCRFTIPVTCQVNDVGQFNYNQIEGLDLVSQKELLALEAAGGLNLLDSPVWLANPDYNFNSITCEFHSELSHGTGRAVCGSTFLAYVTATRVSSVPVPAAIWLFIGGLLGLVSIARKKHNV